MPDILYSFADVSADTGAIKLTDSYADSEVCFHRYRYRFEVSHQQPFRNISLVTLGTKPATTCTGALSSCMYLIFPRIFQALSEKDYRYLLKMKNRNLKVLLSIGGWTYSQAGKYSKLYPIYDR